MSSSGWGPRSWPGMTPKADGCPRAKVALPVSVFAKERFNMKSKIPTVDTSTKSMAKLGMRWVWVDVVSDDWMLNCLPRLAAQDSKDAKEEVKYHHLLIVCLINLSITSFRPSSTVQSKRTLCITKSCLPFTTGKVTMSSWAWLFKRPRMQELLIMAFSWPWEICLKVWKLNFQNLEQPLLQSPVFYYPVQLLCFIHWFSFTLLSLHSAKSLACPHKRFTETKAKGRSNGITVDWHVTVCARGLAVA